MCTDLIINKTGRIEFEKCLTIRLAYQAEVKFVVTLP